MSLVSDERVEELLSMEKRSTIALRFIRDLATEEYGYCKVGTGVEVVLRKIIQKANETLGE